jgi:hypothetical protein
MAKKSIGATNKTKGSNAERFYAEKFRELGFDKCVTSRYGSRIHDDAAIDLINVPFNVQIKAGKQVGLKSEKVLSDIKTRIVDKFPNHAPEHTLPCILIHKKEVGRGKKRSELDELVTMSFEDFSNIIKKIKWD